MMIEKVNGIGRDTPLNIGNRRENWKKKLYQWINVEVKVDIVPIFKATKLFQVRNLMVGDQKESRIVECYFVNF